MLREELEKVYYPVLINNLDIYILLKQVRVGSYERRILSMYVWRYALFNADEPEGMQLSLTLRGSIRAFGSAWDVRIGWELRYTRYTVIYMCDFRCVIVLLGNM